MTTRPPPARPTTSSASSASSASPLSTRAVLRGLPEAFLALGLLGVLLVVVLLDSAVARSPARSALDGTTLGQAGVSYAVTGLIIGGAAVVVLRRGAGRGFGWALAAVGVFWALDGAAQSYVRLAAVTEEPIPGSTFAVWFLYRFTALLPLTIVALPLLFPLGRFVPGRWGVAGRVTVAVMAAAAALQTLTPFDPATQDVPIPPGVDPDPTTIQALAPLAGLAGALFVATLVLGIGVPIGTVVSRFRRATGVDRDRERWLLWGVLIAVLMIVGSALVGSDLAAQVALFVTVNVVPVAMAVAVVNPALVSIEDLLLRTLVVGALLAALVAADLAVLALLTGVLGDTLDQRQVVVVVLLVSVALYGPLRSRLWGWVRRLAFGERDDRYGVVAGLASTLESAGDGQAQLRAVAEAVATAFGIGFVQVEVERPTGERMVVRHGPRPDAVRTLPVRYRDTRVGQLVLPASGLRARLSRRDERLLGDLVRQAATAVHTGRLADELQESRERLVVAREEERRRIRRDLHDGLGPSLGGVVFQLESARLQVDTDPDAARRTLSTTTSLVQDVVADVRRLVHDLRPPALDDRGLVGALGQQAERLRGSDGTALPARVVAQDLPALPAAVEVAAYRIAAEAMTNVARHAEAERCEVRLGVEGDQLVVEVADDGRGMSAETEAGVGLVSLRERAAELGGRSAVTCPPTGGTLVRAWLPLGRSS